MGALLKDVELEKVLGGGGVEWRGGMSGMRRRWEGRRLSEWQRDGWMDWEMKR